MFVAAASFAIASHLAAADELSFEKQAGRLAMMANGKPLATYVWQDAEILRPYLKDVHAASGAQVTRNLPPIEGKDPADHATMHPGIWLAFGDISGADFWRNKGRVVHGGFIEQPKAQGDRGGFTVRNRYVQGDKTICEEVCRVGVELQPRVRQITWQSTFEATQGDFYFGDQEEMGLGIRVATPLAVKSGGTLINSAGQRNEKQAWGQQAAWCDYSGTIDGRLTGIMLIPNARNFRPCWFHARDYGLVVANPFGNKAFTKGPSSKITVKQGERLRLGFTIVIHEGDFDPQTTFEKIEAAETPR